MNLYAIPPEHDPEALIATVMGLPEPETRKVTGKSEGPEPRPNDHAKHLRLIAEALRARHE